MSSIAYESQSTSRFVTGAEAATWPDIDPVLIEDGRRSVPGFTLDLLPLPWRSWVSATARAAGAPVDYAAQALLAAAAGLCGAGASVRVTPAWSERLVLWQALVGRASTGKSPALASMRALLATLEGELGSGEDKTTPRLVVNDPDLDALAGAFDSGQRTTDR